MDRIAASRLAHPTTAAFRRGVLLWFASNRRDLPWRRTTNAWKILVSEVMLQQTQVDRVAERYRSFFRRWPGVRDLAEESLGEVLRFWTGLGYNRRAKGLHAAAHAIVRRHGGRVPKDIDALLALPGVGPYTAAAVMSFAANADVAVCDTNIRRVFLRYFYGGEFAASIPTAAALGEVMSRTLPKGRSRDWHSALMDLGSAVCKSRTPACRACPLRRGCAAASSFIGGSDAPLHRLVRPQARFEGSRRQVRGAVIRRLAEAGPSGCGEAALAASLPGGDLTAILGDLIDEGLVEACAGGYRLPE